MNEFGDNLIAWCPRCREAVRRWAVRDESGSIVDERDPFCPKCNDPAELISTAALHERDLREQAEGLARAMASKIGLVFPSGLDDDQLYTVAQVVALTGFATDTILDRISHGDLLASKPGGSREWRIRRQDYREWRGGRRSAGAEELDPETVARKLLGEG